jgi:hypothetical protein
MLMACFPPRACLHGDTLIDVLLIGVAAQLTVEHDGQALDQAVDEVLVLPLSRVGHTRADDRQRA